MVMIVAKEWEITVSITRTLKYPVEDNEMAEDIWTWANSLDGRGCIQGDFIKRLSSFRHPKNADMTIDDIELKETEVKSTDTDSRV
uniref:Uncharacterized protein n=1 Tax=viral metagenome TaxID=1070528 RepID=A0A6M3Y3V6_9ZZZZ